MVFISPWLLGFILFTAYPILISFYYSFTDFNLIDLTPQWVGTRNYVEMFTRDPLFGMSLVVTFRYVALLIVISTVIDILIALLFNANVRGLAIYRTLIFLPVMIPAVASAMAWIWILNPRHGLINSLLASVGLPGPYWLASPDTALLSLVLMGVWASGRSILIYFAGIKEVPSHLLEAAQIDGAGVIARARHIILPLLTPLIFFNVVTMLIFAFQEFTAPFVMTNGGPANATLFYGLHLYNRAFMDFNMGYASAMAWILFVLILVLSLLLFQTSRRWVTYDR